VWGAVQDDDSEKSPQLFSTFFKVVAIRHKSVHFRDVLVGNSSREPGERQEEFLTPPPLICAILRCD
jgi:hypothetical protein